jgi:hypothetical protein
LLPTLYIFRKYSLPFQKTYQKEPAKQHLQNVLAYTNIPEIYKVGQENKIKIKCELI